MRTLFPLSRNGAVTTWVVSGPKVTDFVAPYALNDQLRFESEMRDLIYTEPQIPTFDYQLGAPSFIGENWSFYSKNRNPYVDFSTFYYSLKNVTFLAATTLLSDKARTVRARVWYYTAFDLFLNGKRVLTEKVPVYKPIRSSEITLDLSEGENSVFIYAQNFGVRDTRNMIMLQLLETDGIFATLDVDSDTIASLYNADQWFTSLVFHDCTIIAPAAPTFDVKIRTASGISDWNSGDRFDTGDEIMIYVEAEVCGQKFQRIFENLRKKKPSHRKREMSDPVKDMAKFFLGKIEYDRLEPAKIIAKSHNYISHTVLCHGLLEGKISDKDVEVLEGSLDIVRARHDCSDFELAGLLRIYLTYDIPETLRRKIKEAALSYRYWMDEQGADAMCFWSENHALTFYDCQLIAGMIFPDEVFLRSGRTGREQYAVACRRIGEWLDVIEAEGFEEFCAGGYMSVTMMALLMVYDFADGDLPSRAKKVMDRICIEACRQCFKGIHMSPMGRIYRSALWPYEGSIQGLLNLIDESNAHGSYAFLIGLGISKYRIPDEARSLLNGSFYQVFESGRAELHSRKRPENFLTSVASPRRLPLLEKVDKETEYYKTKIMNEGFHGTSLFVPGDHGYQQHLWYAALSDVFYVFVNNPGTERDFDSMRPGYWYGNMQFPYIRQKDGELFVRYVISDWNPTKFTHAYYPVWAADEHTERDGFRFARVGEGYLALWCSAPTVLYEADAVAEGDIRAYGEDVCWYVRVGSLAEDGSFSEFIDSVLGSGINSDKVISNIEN